MDSVPACASPSRISAPPKRRGERGPLERIRRHAFDLLVQVPQVDRQHALEGIAAQPGPAVPDRLPSAPAVFGALPDQADAPAKCCGSYGRTVSSSSSRLRISTRSIGAEPTMSTSRVTSHQRAQNVAHHGGTDFARSGGAEIGSWSNSSASRSNRASTPRIMRQPVVASDAGCASPRTGPGACVPAPAGRLIRRRRRTATPPGGSRHGAFVAVGVGDDTTR